MPQSTLRTECPFVSTKSGREEVYVRAFPSGDREVRVSQDGGRDPRWRGDSKELYFLAPDATLVAARINGLQAPVLEKLFVTNLTYTNEKPFVVSRDGRRFLMPVRVGPPPLPSVAVLVNWTARLSKP
jgi:hypothetical protein